MGQTVQIVGTLAACLTLVAGCTQAVSSRSEAPKPAESKTKVTLDTAPEVEIVRVNPYMKLDAGKTRGPMVVDVVLRNKGTAPQRFIVFASGVVRGAQHGGRRIIPPVGKLGPNEEGRATITTPYTGAVLPDEVLVEAGPCLFGPECEEAK